MNNSSQGQKNPSLWHGQAPTGMEGAGSRPTQPPGMSVPSFGVTATLGDRDAQGRWRSRSHIAGAGGEMSLVIDYAEPSRRPGAPIHAELEENASTFGLRGNITRGRPSPPRSEGAVLASAKTGVASAEIPRCTLTAMPKSQPLPQVSPQPPCSRPEQSSLGIAATTRKLPRTWGN